MAIKNLKLNDSDTAYIYLPRHLGEAVSGCVKKTIHLDHLIEEPKGPRVLLDFNDQGELIGIEILV